MSIQFYNAVQGILKMPYYKNQNARSGEVIHGHEDAVGNKLRELGFKTCLKEDYKSITKSILRHWADTGDDSKLRVAAKNMPLGSYITQPAGSQGFPDVLVRDYNDRFIAIECKSVSSTGTPMWNDSLPKPNAIYVLNSGKYNTTTVFLGRDVISPNELAMMKELEEENNRRSKEYELKLAGIDKFNRGWVQRARKQHFQFGGKHKTNYFLHADRQKCEQNVLEYAKQ